MELPPVLSLLLAEVSPSVLRDDRLYKRAISDRGLLQALREQADYSVRSHPYPGATRAASDGLFAFFAPTGLNPFSSEGKCNDFGCRLVNAHSAATLASIYTDFLAVPDEFAQLFCGRPNNSNLSARDRDELRLGIHLYYELEPLIRAGVIRFAPPPGSVCPHCAAAAHPELTSIVDQFWEFFLEEGSVEIHTGPGTPHLEFVSSLYDGLIITHPLSLKEAQALGTLRKPRSDQVRRKQLANFKDVVCAQFTSDVQLALEHASIAADRRLTGATVSRLDALTLRAADGSIPRPHEVDDWQTLRELKLPWVRDLEPTELLNLRDKARTALPVFRELVASRLTSNSAEEARSDARLQSLMGDLRIQAAEVRSELESLSLPRKTSLVGLAAAATIGVTVASLGTSNPIALTAAGGLATLLASLHQNAAAAEHDKAKAIAKPGYLLVAANEMLRHRGGPSTTGSRAHA